MIPNLYDMLDSKSKTNAGEGSWRVITSNVEKNAFVLQHEITGFLRTHSSEELDIYYKKSNL